MSRSEVDVANQWCRLYRETITDPKLSRLTAAQRYIWTVLMCLAIDGDGVVEIAEGVGYTAEEIAALAGAEIGETELALAWFARAKMTTTTEDGVIGLVNWDQRQFKSDHDSAERQRRSREYRRTVSRDSHNMVSRDCHWSDTDTDTDTDIHTICPEPEADSEPEAVISFPVTGKDTAEWGLTSGYLAELGAAFPYLDVLAEARKARAWIVGNPSRRKTTRGMPRFLFGWMERTQNKGGAQPAVKSAPTYISVGAHSTAANPWNSDDVREYGGDPPKHQRWDEYLDFMADKPGPWPRFAEWLKGTT